MFSWDYLPPGVREHIAPFLPSLRGPAFVNRDWNDSVLHAINNLRNEFNDGTFQLDWLIAEWGGVFVNNPELRLQRLLDIHHLWPLHDEGIWAETRRWWYNIQLHLHHFWVQYQRARGHSLTFEMFFHLCYRQSWFNRRRCRELFPEMFGAHGGFITDRQFLYLGFLETRDLSCPHLGFSVREVFGTLSYMVINGSYCRVGGECGCTMQDRVLLYNSASESDSNRSCAQSDSYSDQDSDWSLSFE